VGEVGSLLPHLTPTRCAPKSGKERMWQNAVRAAGKMPLGAGKMAL